MANSWRTERWDSLRLLTPNWQSQLPGAGYDGDDPNGYMSMPEVVDFITSYAATISAPIQSGTTVTQITPACMWQASMFSGVDARASSMERNAIPKSSVPTSSGFSNKVSRIRQLRSALARDRSAHQREERVGVV